MAVEVASMAADPNSLRGLQGPATDERAAAGARNWCTWVGGREHPWVGVVVGVGPRDSADEGCLVCGSQTPMYSFMRLSVLL